MSSDDHSSQARLKGALRRLDIPTTDEFDEGEYAEATDSVYKAVSGVCSQSRWVATALDVDKVRHA